MPNMPILSDDTLLRLNESIEKALKAYLNPEVQVRFDLPNPEEKVSEPTVSVFLFDMQEDLQLRHTENRFFNKETGVLQPGHVHVRCCYLITYWDLAEGSHSTDAPATVGPRSQSIVIMNQVLNALINHRSLPDIKCATYTRIIQPSEQLNSLGNFWQSLGNKPRLSLSYAVTVPIQLSDKNDIRTPVKEPVEVQLVQGIEQQENVSPPPEKTKAA